MIWWPRLYIFLFILLRSCCSCLILGNSPPPLGGSLLIYRTDGDAVSNVMVDTEESTDSKNETNFWSNIGILSVSRCRVPSINTTCSKLYPITNSPVIAKLYHIMMCHFLNTRRVAVEFVIRNAEPIGAFGNPFR